MRVPVPVAYEESARSLVLSLSAASLNALNAASDWV